MALRIRKCGKILCAAMHESEHGDMYIDDFLHYCLSANLKVIVTEPHIKHQFRGEWWWYDSIPNDVEIEDFYLE